MIQVRNCKGEDSGQLEIEIWNLIGDRNLVLVILVRDVFELHVISLKTF